MSKTLTFIYILLFASNVWAARPTLVKEAGQPVTVSWPDGRQISIQRSVNDFVHTPVRFQILENTCFTQWARDSVVEYLPIYRTDVLAAIWQAHPNADRIGKVVERSFGGDFQEVKTHFRMTPGMESQFESFFTHAPMQKVKIPVGAPATMRLSAWLSERMVRNPQTGEDENMVVAGAYESKLVKENDYFKIEDLGFLFNMDGFERLPFIGDVVSWQMPQGNDNCFMAFLPDLTPMNTAIASYEAQLNDFDRVYVWQEDETSEFLETNAIEFLEFGQSYPVDVR